MVDNLQGAGLRKVNPGQPYHSARSAAVAKKSEASFAQALEEATRKPLNFSAHALQRLESRHVKLQAEDLQKISAAVEKAAAKGARSSLILYHDLALLASVLNRTVITAVDGSAGRERIFTNIDSAVIIE